MIDSVGDQVPTSRVGDRVWCFGAQSYRPFGTAAQSVVVPSQQAVPLPGAVSFEQGACLGIPGITAHRAVHIGGPVQRRVVLLQGGAGAVGQSAIALARHAGASVIASVRSERDADTAREAHAINAAIQREWPGFAIGACLPLESIAKAHELLEAGETAGRVVLTLETGWRLT